MTDHIGADTGLIILGSSIAVIVVVTMTVQSHGGIVRAMGTVGLILGEAIVLYFGYGVLIRVVRPATHVLVGSH